MNPCPCGKPWPNLDLYDRSQREWVDQCVAAMGEYVLVTVGTRTWRVLRRCIAYHGISAQQLASGRSGFTEVVVPRH